MRIFLLIALLTTLFMLPAPARAQITEAQQISMEFPGGGVGDFVQRIRRQIPGVNIVVLDPADRFILPPMTLSGVEVGTALDLLDHMIGDINGRPAQLSYDLVTGLTPIHRIDAELDTRTRSVPRISRVLAVASLLDSGVEPDALLSSIEAALGLIDSRNEPVQIRFHEETSLLIARGYPEQVQTIETVIDSLLENAHHWEGQRVMAEQQAAEIDAMQKTLQQLSAEVNALVSERDRLRHRNEQLQTEITELRSRVDSLRTSGNDAR